MRKIETVVDGVWGSGVTRAAPSWSLPARPVIGVDCDGVLASDRLLWQRLRERFPEHIPAHYEDLASFEWPRATPETAALCLELSADPQFAAQLAPIPHMVEALRALAAHDFTVYVVTARPECVRQATRVWLRRHGVSDCVAGIHCVASGLAKVPLALELGCQVFVEDNYTTAEAIGDASIRSYLLDAPYNRAPTKSSIRVRGWRALLADLATHVPTTPQPAVASLAS